MKVEVVRDDDSVEAGIGIGLHQLLRQHFPAGADGLGVGMKLDAVGIALLELFFKGCGIHVRHTSLLRDFRYYSREWGIGQFVFGMISVYLWPCNC